MMKRNEKRNIILWNFERKKIDIYILHANSIHLYNMHFICDDDDDNDGVKRRHCVHHLELGTLFVSLDR